MTYRWPLRPAWQNTIGSPGTTCDLPLYEGFIRAIRDVNVALPSEQRIRVLLGDPPVDWDALQTTADAIKWAEMRIMNATILDRSSIS